MPGLPGAKKQKQQEGEMKQKENRYVVRMVNVSKIG